MPRNLICMRNWFKLTIDFRQSAFGEMCFEDMKFHKKAEADSLFSLFLRLRHFQGLGSSVVFGNHVGNFPSG